MAPKKSLAQRFADLDKPAKDFDPENEAPEDDSQESDSDSDIARDERAVTEHYEAVGKSKLRQKHGVSLGPKYRGAVVSRAALEESSDDDDEDEAEDEAEVSGSEAYDDPDLADLERDHIDEDFEIDSDEAFGESDEEKFGKFSFAGSAKKKAQSKGKLGVKADPSKQGKRPVAADFYTDSGEGSNVEQDEGSEEEDSEEDGFDELEPSDGESSIGQNGAELDDEDEDEDEDEDDEEKDEEDDDESEVDEEEESETSDVEDAQHAELRQLMREGQKNIAADVAKAVRADAEKGVAVRQQRRAFDSILNLRIRLQKALVAANSFTAVDGEQTVDKEPYLAAEEAAIKLWNTLDRFRETLVPSSQAKTGDKRKREFDLDASTQDIWDSMVSSEKQVLAYRRKVLDKWSSRVRSSNVQATTRKLQSASTQTLVSVLDDHLLNSDRLVKRSRTPRSCAPVQAAKKVDEDVNIYDDADFYQMLLKELVEQRSTDTTAPGASVTTVRWAAIKEAKTRKQVDRRASKGRKLRFTVHEKLQNFMAPEDRRTWEQDAIDRFVGALFGQKLDLKDVEEEDAEMGGVEIDGGFRLFQSK